MANTANPVLHHDYDRDGDHLPLALGDTWLYAVADATRDGDDIRLDGTLYVLVSGQGDARQRLADIERDVRHELPRLDSIVVDRFAKTNAASSAAGADGERPDDSLLDDVDRPHEEPPPSSMGSQSIPGSGTGGSHDFDEPPPSRFRT